MTDDLAKRLRAYSVSHYPTRYGACMEEAADEIERLRGQRDRYAERFLKLQADYADLLRIANTYYMACLHPNDPCKPCQDFEEHVHD